MMKNTTPPTGPGFDALVEHHYQPLFNFAVRLCGTPEGASDLTQQAFYLAFTRAGQLREPGRFKQWLFTILFREFLHRRRHQTKFRHESLDDSPVDLPGEGRHPAEGVDARLAREALGGLDELHRAPLSLFYLHDLTYREIAEKLEIPIGTVMSRISRAKQLLRDRLEPRAASAHWQN